MKKRRFSLDVSQETSEQWDQIQFMSDEPTLVGTIRKAMNLYEIVLTQFQTKGRVILENTDGSKEILRIL